MFYLYLFQTCQRAPRAVDFYSTAISWSCGTQRSIVSVVETGLPRPRHMLPCYLRRLTRWGAGWRWAREGRRPTVKATLAFNKCFMFLVDLNKDESWRAQDTSIRCKAHVTMLPLLRNFAEALLSFTGVLHWSPSLGSYQGRNLGACCHAGLVPFTGVLHPGFLPGVLPGIFLGAPGAS